MRRRSRRAIERAILLAIVTALGGCRACGSSTEASADASGQRPLPTGILAPIAVSDAGARTAEKLRVAHHQKGGEWIELQVAAPGDRPDRTTFDHWRDDSLFLPVDAMMLLHGAFSEAYPGFDLFVPLLFDRAAVGRLRSRLEAFRTRWSAIGTAAEAKQRWSAVSSFVSELDGDGAWLAARAALATTIDELVAFCQRLEDKNQALWILGI